MVKLPIYFDYMATTPVDPLVAAKMMMILSGDGLFGNPASVSHVYGTTAAMVVQEAREQVAKAIHAEASDIVFTSGATEANNLAILGAARFYKRKGKHLITMSTEHKSVLDSFQQLEKEGFRVSYLPPDKDGLLDLQLLLEALTPETILVSIMHVNNEIGVVQDIQVIGDLLRNKGIVFHVDAAQSAGKIALDLHALPVDLMSFSAHKNYGPKGIGALYVRRKPRIRLEPQSFGGGHEGGLRSGTLATHQIAGMGEAFMLAEAVRVEEQERIYRFRDLLWNGIKLIPGIRLNGHYHQRVAGNLNVSFAGIEGSSLLLALHELAVSNASACVSASAHPSYVLKALGLSDELIYSTIRFCIGRFTTEDDIRRAIMIIDTQVRRLQEISPQ